MNSTVENHESIKTAPELKSEPAMNSIESNDSAITFNEQASNGLL